jgi:transposase
VVPDRRPSYEDLAGEVVELRAVVERLTARLDVVEAENAELRAENAELKRRLGMDSTNSSVPPSKESMAAKAKRRLDRSSRVRSAERTPGGQPGRKGSGLVPTPDPDHTERVQPPAQCRDCCAELTGATVLPEGWAQVWDVAPAQLHKTHYLLPRRRCGCGVSTTATPPFGRAGSVSYGPNLNAAAVLLGSEGNVPVERTAMLIHALLGVQVSTGFVARAAQRLAEALQGAGFDEVMKAALRAQDVLCGDESPVNVLTNDLDENSDKPVAGAPHAVTLRTPDARLVWYTAMPSRSKDAIADLGVLDDWHGFLVRDDYAGWHQFDAHLAGVQQCCAHLIRHCKGVLQLHPDWQQWAETVIGVLSDTAKAVDHARAAGADQLDPELLAELRERYDKAVTWGITTNRHRDWHKGNHPGYTLATRLKDKAEQVWLFAKNFAIPWTNYADVRVMPMVA